MIFKRPISSTPSLPINIQDLLKGKPVEWERLEFKAGWNPLDTLHTVCAFANDFHNLGGGYIIIGIAEKNGRPVLPPMGLDVKEIDAIQKELLNLGHSAIQPYYHPIVVPAEINSRHILIIWVLGGQTRPYKAKLSLNKNSKEYGYFIRKGSSTVRTKGADETELLSLAATVPFDDRFNQQAKIEDLSRELMLAYLQEVNSELAGQANGTPANASSSAKSRRNNCRKNFYQVRGRVRGRVRNGKQYPELLAGCRFE